MDEFIEHYSEAWYMVELERDILASAIGKAFGVKDQ